jgi:hypothetical protein
MARDYAQNRLAMWNDDHFRQLTDGAQNLYNYLLAHPTTTYAGVVDWRPARLQAVNVSWTAGRVRELGAELMREHYIVIDEDTEEAVIRSFLRWESILKSPNLTRAAVKAFKAVQSRVIRGVIAFELGRLRSENPDWAAWEVEELDDELVDVEPIDAKAGTLSGTLRETLPETLRSTLPEAPSEAPDGTDANPLAKGSAITSNRYPLTRTTQPNPRVENAETGEKSEEWLCKRQLLGLKVDYDRVRKSIAKTCGRVPAPSDVVRISVGILAKGPDDIGRPTGYIITSIENDWAIVQQFLDEEGAMAS